MRKNRKHLSQGATDIRQSNYTIETIVKQFNSLGIKLHPAGVWEWNDERKKIAIDANRTDGLSLNYYPKDNMLKHRPELIGIAVIDNDGAKVKEVMKRFPTCEETFYTETSSSKKQHYYLYPPEGKVFPQSRSVKKAHLNIDVLTTGIVFEAHDYQSDTSQFTMNNTEIKRCTNEEYNLICEVLETTQDEDEKSTYTGHGMSKKEVKHLLTFLNILDYTDRDSWIRILASIHDALNSDGEKIARKWSQGDSEQYDDGSFDAIWSQLDRGQYGTSISAGTLIHEATQNGYINDHSYVFPKREGCASEKADGIKSEAIPNKFNTKLLPKDVQDFVSQGSVALDNSPSSMFGVSVMIMLGNAISRRVGVRVKQNDTWTEYPNFWGALIAPPSFKKSPIIKAVSSPIKLAEGRAADRHKEEISKYEKEMDIYKLEKSIHDKAFKAGDTKVELPDQPKRPVKKRHLVSDATIEAVGQIMVDNPNGILLLMDELSAFFSRLTAANREADRSFWLEAYTHQINHPIDRIGRGSIIIPHVIAGIFGSIQPDIIQKIVYDTKKGATGGDGLLQRFQLSVIETTSNYEFKDTGIESKYREKYFNLFDKVLKRSPEAHGAKVDVFEPFQRDVKDEDKAYYYRFSKEATKVFEKWSESNNIKIRKVEKYNPALAAHFGKYSGTFAKIALVLFYCDRVTGRTKENVIDAKYARKAIEWLKFLESHARVIYDIGEIEKKQEKTLKDKIVAKVKEVNLPIHLGTLSRSIRGAKKKDIEKALEGIAYIKGSQITRLL